MWSKGQKWENSWADCIGGLISKERKETLLLVQTQSLPTSRHQMGAQPVSKQWAFSGEAKQNYPQISPIFHC